jgi:hypothetical protein
MYAFIQTLRFGEITDIEFDLVPAVSIFYAKVKPLHMSLCIGVNPQKQIKLGLFYLDDAIKIARLKDAIENVLFF